MSTLSKYINKAEFQHQYQAVAQEIGIVKTDDTATLQLDMIRLAAFSYAFLPGTDYGYKTPPQFLEHMFHVIEIAKRSREVLLPDATSDIILDAIHHDEGRLSFGRRLLGTFPKLKQSTYHAEAGYWMMEGLGYDEVRRAITLDHDQWSLGRNLEGRRSKAKAVKKLFQRIDESPNKDGVLGEFTPLLPVYQAMPIPHVIVALADQSKINDDKYDSYKSRIQVFTPALGIQLFNDQVRSDRLQVGTERYNTEKYGPRFMEGMLRYAKTILKFPYEEAVSRAQDSWFDTEYYLLNNWRDQIDIFQRQRIFEKNLVVVSLGTGRRAR